MSHKIEFIGANDYGYNTRLVCPEDCTEKDIHRDQWNDVGIDLLTPVKEDVVLCAMHVIPEWKFRGTDAEEMWLNPIVQDED